MLRLASFRLDHEAADSPHDTAVLRHLQALGVELGAAVALFYCPHCDVADAVFDYPDPAPPRDSRQ